MCAGRMPSLDNMSAGLTNPVGTVQLHEHGFGCVCFRKGQKGPLSAVDRASAVASVPGGRLSLSSELLGSALAMA